MHKKSAKKTCTKKVQMKRAQKSTLRKNKKECTKKVHRNYFKLRKFCYAAADGHRNFF